MLKINIEHTETVRKAIFDESESVDPILFHISLLEASTRHFFIHPLAIFRSLRLFSSCYLGKFLCNWRARKLYV